jgi:hypothetical protein
MLSRETLAKYRRMTPGERLKLTLELSDKHMSSLFKGTPREIERRFERMRRDKAERNFNMLMGLARHRYVMAGLLDKEVPLDEFRDRAKQYQEAIRQILLHDWNPIEVDQPQLDEYHPSVWQIFELLMMREPKQKLVDFLLRLKAEYLKKSGNRMQIEQLAERLFDLPAQFNPPSA